MPIDVINAYKSRQLYTTNIELRLSLIMVTITRHVFINTFQTEHFSAVKFAMGYEKNMSFLVLPNLQK